MSAEFGTISDLAPRLRSGEVSSERLTRACLEHIERLNPTLNAFITVTAEAARSEEHTSELQSH